MDTVPALDLDLGDEVDILGDRYVVTELMATPWADRYTIVFEKVSDAR